MVWVQWVVRLLTHRNCLGILTEVVSVMVRLLTQRNGILTELGWMVRLLTQAGLGTMDGQITQTSWSGYNGWSDYSHKLVWVQCVVRLLTHREGLGTVAGEIDTY